MKYGFIDSSMAASDKENQISKRRKESVQTQSYFNPEQEIEERSVKNEEKAKNDQEGSKNVRGR